MRFEPTTLRDLVRCSNHWATGDSMVPEQGPICGSRLESHHAATQPSVPVTIWLCSGGNVRVAFGQL